MFVFISNTKESSKVSTILSVTSDWLGLGSRVFWNHAILWLETGGNSAARRESLLPSELLHGLFVTIDVLSFVHDCNDIAYVFTSLSASNCPLQPPPDVYVFDCKHQESDTVLFYSYIRTLFSAAFIKHVATIRPYAFVTISHIH